MQGKGYFLAYPCCWNLTMSVLFESIALPPLVVLRNRTSQTRIPSPDAGSWFLSVSSSGYYDSWLLYNELSYGRNCEQHHCEYPDNSLYGFLTLSLDIFPINLSSYQRTLYQTVIVS